MTGIKAKRELKIFLEFINVSDLPVKFGSEKNRNPPEPDILCQLKDNGYLAFELVEIIDPYFARRLNVCPKINKNIRNYYDKLPQEKHNLFKSKFSNACLLFDFKETASLNKRLSSIESIFEHLFMLDSSFEGTALKYKIDFSDVLLCIHISRGNFSGPFFDTDATGFVGNPTENVINKKIKKCYKTKHPIELLAYIDMNDMPPDDHWIPDVSKFLQKVFNNSVFRRIWIYDIHNKAIKYLYPSL